MGGKPKLKPDSVGHMGEKKRFLTVSDGFLGYSLVEDLHWKWKMVPWKTMFLYKERGAPLSMTISGRVSIQASLTVRNALAMRSPRGQKAGDAAKRKEVVMLFGHLEQAASAGEGRLAYELYLRLLEADPNFTTPALDPTMPWKACQVLENQAEMRSAMQLNEAIFGKLLQVANKAAALSEEDMLRHWHQVHGHDPSKGDPYLVLALNDLQKLRPRLEVFHRPVAGRRAPRRRARPDESTPSIHRRAPHGMESKYSKSKARQDAIKPALAFFCGLGASERRLHGAVEMFCLRGAKARARLAVDGLESSPFPCHTLRRLNAVTRKLKMHREEPRPETSWAIFQLVLQHR
ncbi:unnamed protein product [Durusdinium trenchii]|uniref:Uncharacterized protein n=1 Tax=Durusdinium trenchii TaxID=1381693 RepID=A0ABP0Q3Z5_9DINO